MTTDELWQTRDALDVAAQQYEELWAKRSPTTARDDRSVVTVAISSGLALESVTLAHSWARYYEGQQLAPIIQTVFAKAMETALVSWEAAAKDAGPAPVPRPVPTAADLAERGLNNSVTDVTEDQLAALDGLLDSLLANVDQALAQMDNPTPAGHTGTSVAGHVTITLTAGGQLQGITLRPGWPERNAVTVVNREIAEALEAAQGAASDASSDTRSAVGRLNAITQQLQDLTGFAGAW